MYHKNFKRGYAHAIANVIHLFQDNYGITDQVPHLPRSIELAWKCKSWRWDELIDAGVAEQDLVVLEHHQKQLGLGPRPIPPKGDQI